MSVPSRQFLPASPELLARLPPGLLAELNVPADVAHWLGAILHTIQAVGDSSYIPAGTVVLPPELPPIPSTADEIDQAIAAL